MSNIDELQPGLKVYTREELLAFTENTEEEPQLPLLPKKPILFFDQISVQEPQAEGENFVIEGTIDDSETWGLAGDEIDPSLIIDNLWQLAGFVFPHKGLEGCGRAMALDKVGFARAIKVDERGQLTFRVEFPEIVKNREVVATGTVVDSDGNELVRGEGMKVMKLNPRLVDRARLSSGGQAEIPADVEVPAKFEPHVLDLDTYEVEKNMVYAAVGIEPSNPIFTLHFKGDPVMPGAMSGIKAPQKMLIKYAVDQLGWKEGGIELARVVEAKFDQQIFQDEKIVDYALTITAQSDGEVKASLRVGMCDIDGEPMNKNNPIYTVGEITLRNTQALEARVAGTAGAAHLVAAGII